MPDRMPDRVAGLIRAVGIIAMAAYPFLVFLFLQLDRIVLLGVVTTGFGVMRILWRWYVTPKAGGLRTWLPDPMGAVMVLTGISAALLGQIDTILLYPVFVNFMLLITFGLSLQHPPTVIERMARLKEPELSAAAVAYTRTVTKVWCLFFVLNGMAALGTALFASIEIWTLYNGAIAYVLIGTLFCGEYLVRRRVITAERGSLL